MACGSSSSGGNPNDTPIAPNLGIIDSRLWSSLRDLPSENLNAAQRDGVLLGRAITEEIDKSLCPTFYSGMTGSQLIFDTFWYAEEWEKGEGAGAMSYFLATIYWFGRLEIHHKISNHHPKNTSLPLVPDVIRLRFCEIVLVYTFPDVLDRHATYMGTLAKHLMLVHNRLLERWKVKNNGTKKKQ